jgi:hypothetical protein
MVADKPINLEVWHAIYGAMIGAVASCTADQEDKRGVTPLQRISGHTYMLAKRLQAMGVSLDIPQEVLDACEPKIAAPAVEAVKESSSIPKVVFESTIGKATSLLGKIGHALKVVPEEPKQEEG